jgi:hypothetical protein
MSSAALQLREIVTDTPHAMLWFFTRQHSRLHYEIRRQTDSEDFEIVITHPDGRQEVERYSDAKKLLNRSIELQNSLKQEGWQPLG